MVWKLRRLLDVHASRQHQRSANVSCNACTQRFGRSVKQFGHRYARCGIAGNPGSFGRGPYLSVCHCTARQQACATVPVKNDGSLLATNDLSSKLQPHRQRRHIQRQGGSHHWFRVRISTCRLDATGQTWPPVARLQAIVDKISPVPAFPRMKSSQSSGLKPCGGRSATATAAIADRLQPAKSPTESPCPAGARNAGTVSLSGPARSWPTKSRCGKGRHGSCFTVCVCRGRKQVLRSLRVRSKPTNRVSPASARTNPGRSAEKGSEESRCRSREARQGGSRGREGSHHDQGRCAARPEDCLGTLCELCCRKDKAWFQGLHG